MEAKEEGALPGVSVGGQARIHTQVPALRVLASQASRAMTALTVNERKAAERERRKALGLTRLEIYANKADHEAIKALAEKLQRRRARAIKTQRSKDVA